MLKYQVLDYVRRNITIILSADPGNSFAPIVITGNRKLKAIVEDILDTS